METGRLTRVLVIANRTAATPWLLQEIEQRSKGGPCQFALLVPPTGGRHPDWTLDVALAQVQQAAGRAVQTVQCDPDWISAARHALSAVASGCIGTTPVRARPRSGRARASSLSQ